jgi:hypothetical protein
MKYVLQFFVGVLVLYVIASFVSGMWNPVVWPVGGRISFVVFGFICGICSLMLFNADEIPL